MNTDYRKPLADTGLEYFDTRAAMSFDRTLGALVPAGGPVQLMDADGNLLE